MAIFTQDNFTGGIADGSKSGYTNQQTGMPLTIQNGIGLDFRSDPDSLTLQRALKLDSGVTVTGLVKWFVAFNGSVYSYDNAGKIYLRDISGVWTNPKTVSSSTGQGFGVFRNNGWYASSTSLGKIANLDTTPVYTDDYFLSHTNEIDQSSTGTGSTYTVPTTITETATHRKSFTAGQNNITGCSFTIGTKGTGNITFTVHDASNNKIAAITYTNASLVGGAFNIRVNFTGKYTLVVGVVYHIHITSTVADATITTSTLNDLTTAVFSEFYYYNELDVDQRNDLRSTLNMNTGFYTVKSALSEDATDKRSFTPVKSLLQAISLQVLSKGTGNITVTVHDSLDTLVATKTVTNASFATNQLGGMYRFDFGTAVSVIPGATYHIHIFSTVASDTLIETSTNADFSTASYFSHYAILMSDADYHPMAVFTNKILIGNGQFLAWIDDSEIYEPQAITFPKGERVRCIETIGDYAAISTWQGTNISDSDKSRIYFWDGTETTFNAFIDVDGQVNAIKNLGNNKLMIIHGTEGNISIYSGGITYKRRMKNVGIGKTVEVWPGAIGVWEKLLIYGVSNGTSTSIERVLSMYGTKDNDYNNAMSKDFPISTGLYDSTVQIGAVLGLSSSLMLVSWKSGSNYGVDVIDNANYQSSGYFETMRLDMGQPHLVKNGKTVSLRTKGLSSSHKIEVKYRINNSDTYISLGFFDGTVDAGKVLKTFVLDKDFLEIEFKVLITTTDTTSPPVFYSIGLDYEIRGEFQIKV